MKEIILNQISNPGISFTKDVNDKMLSLYEFLQKNKDAIYTYQQFQDELIKNNLFTGSYIRSFIPFLYNAGMVNDYSNNVDCNNLFTKNGLLYIKINQSIKIAEENADDSSKLLNIRRDLLCMSLDYMIKNKYKFYKNYLNIIRFVKENGTIDREDFYILYYCIQNNLDYTKFTESNKKEDFDIYIKSNNNEIMSYRSNNAFNYLIAFLADEQCNYVKKTNQSNYEINMEREEFIDSVLNQNEIGGEEYE